MSPKPELSFRQIWNMCFGFMAIQLAFSLQNADVSRIFQTLGADLGPLGFALQASSSASAPRCFTARCCGRW